MRELIKILCEPEHPEKSSQEIQTALKNNCWVQLTTNKENQDIFSTKCLPRGPGVVIKSGGSTGGPQQCLHECSHLDQSAMATGIWLEDKGLLPKNCKIFNPLPIHHVSGLMPWWRSICWGSKHIWLKPSLIRNPQVIEETCNLSHYLPEEPSVISLVPTQLHRLLQNPAGIEWLKGFSVIWIGGAYLPKKLALQARALNIKLSPCYGTTETAAMITAQDPTEFLAGITNSGQPLMDVALRLGESNALQIRTPRIANAKLINGKLESITDKDGWWESGDAAELERVENFSKLKILGRLDNAIHSGGETIYPEKLQTQLLKACEKAGIRIEALLLIPIEDEEWGERLVGLVKLQNQAKLLPASKDLLFLKKEVANWAPYEKPIDWLDCPKLKPNILGKWEIQRWKTWAKNSKNLYLSKTKASS